MKTCHGCPATITSRRKWCSESCRVAAFRREHPEYRRPPDPPKPPKPREPRKLVHGIASSYKSGGCRCPECREAVRIEAREYVARRAAQGNPIEWNPRDDKKCRHCARSYQGTRQQRYCSPSCGNQARHARTAVVRAAAREAARERRIAEQARSMMRVKARRRLARAAEGTASRSAAWVTLRCVICTAPFTTKWKTAEHNEVSCSPECQAINAKARRQLGSDRRRARKKAAYVADVYRKTVYERDGWRCHLCGKPVERSAAVPHPKAPTIDHLIPLAAGGTHEPLNCRTAHFLCNSLKGDRGGGEQLLLIA